MNICSETSCSEFVKVKGFCQKHYYVHRRKERAKLPCRISGCVSPSTISQMCATHYYRYKAEEAATEGRLCLVEGCGSGVQAKGYCHSHYNQIQKGRTPKPAVCVFSGCSEISKAAGSKCPIHYDSCIVDGCVSGTKDGAKLCKMHSLRLMREGDVGESTRRRGKSGTRKTKEWHTNSHGYVQKVVRISGKNFTILQHRVVMEENLGRQLMAHENVHHKNGDRTDNRIENLELWSSSQPAGQRVEDKLQWAKEIISLYEKDFGA